MIFNMAGGNSIKEASGTVDVSTSVVTVALDFEPIAVFVDSPGSSGDKCTGAFLVFDGALYRAFDNAESSRPSNDFAPNGKGFNIKNSYSYDRTYRWRAIGI